MRARARHLVLLDAHVQRLDRGLDREIGRELDRGLKSTSCCLTRTSRGTSSDLVQPPSGDSHSTCEGG